MEATISRDRAEQMGISAKSVSASVTCPHCGEEFEPPPRFSTVEEAHAYAEDFIRRVAELQHKMEEIRREQALWLAQATTDEI